MSTNRSFIRVFYGQDPEKIDEEFVKRFRGHIYEYYSTFFDEEKCERIVIDNLATHLRAGRMIKIKDNIRRAIEEKIKFPFVCYTFGEENHKYLLSLGINSVLVHEFSNPFYMYRHKLEAWKLGMRDFDEVVFLDWDTRPIKEIDENFWDLLNKKDVIQAALGHYRRQHISHRIGRQNKTIPTGAFTYFRDKSLPDRIIELWKKEAHFYSCEPPLARLTDEMMGGWNIEEYYRRFEPSVFSSVSCPYRQKDPNEIYIYCRGGGKHY